MTIPANNPVESFLESWKTIFNLAPADTALIIRYVQFLMGKNQELNLVSRKMDLKTLIDDHIADCLAGKDYLASYSSITDIGSGGGLPGILLGILFPEKKITLVDKSPKKTDFLKEAVKYLQLKNTRVICGELSQISVDSDCITCRAFKPLDVILDLTRSSFHRHVSYILYKGRLDTIQEEIRLAGKHFQFLFEVHHLDFFKEKERNILQIQKK